MNILLVNSLDKGGAANSCLRLYKGLFTLGENPKLLIQRSTKNLPSVELGQPFQPKFTKVQKAKKVIKKILKELNLSSTSPLKEIPYVWKRSSQLEMFSYPKSNYDLTQATGYKEADIINLHWVANFLDYESFFSKNSKPVVWTLHDMNPFTGGEHYSEIYAGIDEEGFPVKRVIADFEKQEFEKVIRIKKRALSKIENLTIVAPSQWLAIEAKNSEVFKGRPVHCIPNGLDSEIFAPRNKSFSRKLFSIPENKVMILFVAEATNTPRKGFFFLQRAIEQLKMKDIILCSVGSKKSELKSIKGVLELGSISDERLMSVVYSAADVFVIPSIMDNLPNTVMESLMCGTPVIGFPVGGIPEMIEEGVNGMLTKDISVPSLLKTLQEFLNSPKKFDRKRIRKDAIMKYNLQGQANNYVNLFKEILDNEKK